jgi:hypothetical protein
LLGLLSFDQISPTPVLMQQLMLACLALRAELPLRQVLLKPQGLSNVQFYIFLAYFLQIIMLMVSIVTYHTWFAN